ncbi:MAG: acyl-CoA carboxylase subunit beta, partial [Cyclobacteriaceae bacterium]|nr:acyl-CoA carboxylase subunit beta [Cyclobacteriaceae bacterium]
MNPTESKNKSLETLLTELSEKYQVVKKGGGDKRIAKEHDKGKLTARERIDYLRDEGSDFLEVGAFAADGMYEEEGGCPSAGVVTGIGFVSGRMCMIVANDATVKAGAWFPMTAKKNLRAQEIAM